MSRSSARTALVAPDSFKGTHSAQRVAELVSFGLAESGWEAVARPLADGGEGTTDALLGALGGELVETRAEDALGQTRPAVFGVLADGSAAIVETAQASGLALLAPEERDPLRASTYGTGRLIVEAAAHARRVLIGVGGSATTDGGAGALAAIDELGGIGDTELVCVCDVATPWERCAAVFGPQKGAGPGQVVELEHRLERLAEELPRDPRGRARTGAAGGLAGGLWAVHRAVLEPGAALVCDAVGFDRLAEQAELIVTGEGRLDRSTLEGKVVDEVATRARRAGTPVHAIVGSEGEGPSVAAQLDLASVRVASAEGEIRAAASELGRAPAPSASDVRG